MYVNVYAENNAKQNKNVEKKKMEIETELFFKQTKPKPKTKIRKREKHNEMKSKLEILEFSKMIKNVIERDSASTSQNVNANIFFSIYWLFLFILQ